MSEPTLTAFVLRCQQALEKYRALRAEGYDHEQAHSLSGLMAAVKGQPADPVSAAREVRRIIAQDGGE